MASHFHEGLARIRDRGRDTDLLASARDTIRERSLVSNNNWLGLAVPLVFLLYGLLFPRIGAALSFHERKHVIELLKGALMAGTRPLREMKRNWETSLDSWWG